MRSSLKIIVRPYFGELHEGRRCRKDVREVQASGAKIVIPKALNQVTGPTCYVEVPVCPQ